MGNFVKQVFTGDQVRNWQHATRIFVDNDYALAPKFGFLFYVYFELNPKATRFDKKSKEELGMLAKTVSLPKYTIETKTLNAYNRPNIVQNGVKYDPVNLTFHDDTSNVMRQFWYDYYQYYYRDSDYQLSSYSSPYKYTSKNDATGEWWGYTRRNDNKEAAPENYITAIHIYSLHQKKFTEYVLINPTIKNW